MSWFTDCKVLPGIGKRLFDRIDHSVASIGHNQALLAYSCGDEPVEQFAILSLTEGGTIHTQSVPGPPNPDGVGGMRLYRVGEVVVAYGGSVSSEGQRGEEPCWYMAVYYIDTDEWETLPYVQWKCPFPRRRPRVFSVGDTLVVAGGWGKTTARLEDYWEWSLETRLWRQMSGCPIGEHAGATHGTSHHIYSLTRHYTYIATRRVWSTEKCHIPGGSPVFSLSLYGECQLLATKLTDVGGTGGNGPRKAVPMLRDNVSLDRVALDLLPLSDIQYTSLDKAKAVWLNPCTILVVAIDFMLLVEVDPSLLSPYVLF
ncbi:hypothetical protein KIPB_009725 [Kipferlia bialata]|uniref:Uncharacterized protein n=1 Tax=Kipferlia bialata TaxID=797122 RepID=A0A9K3D2S3_9EUKA|nr:hypothetical protein KIPB_009725 [Kipferlia bialata]|eukprot:g9725.t1